MIKANELRIGNWINYCLVAYKQIDLFDLTCIINGEDREDIYKPIPLTEEILLKFPEWFRNFISNGYFNLEALPNGYMDCKYLHSAQNLYFALTGEELTVNL